MGNQGSAYREKELKRLRKKLKLWRAALKHGEATSPAQLAYNVEQLLRPTKPHYFDDIFKKKPVEEFLIEATRPDGTKIKRPEEVFASRADAEAVATVLREKLGYGTRIVLA